MQEYSHNSSAKYPVTDKYAENWNRIFGKKTLDKKEIKEENEPSEPEWCKSI